MNDRSTANIVSMVEEDEAAEDGDGGGAQEVACH